MKMLRLSQFAAAPLMMLWMAAPSLAAPLDHKHLPQEAKWVLHVDLEAITGSDLVAQVRENRPAIANQVRQWIQDRYGIDPREDLHSLTAFSDTYQANTGVMILKATYDQNKVASELQNQPNVQSMTWQNYTLYTVEREGMLERRADRIEQRRQAAPQTQPGQAQPGQAQPGQAQPGQAQPGQVQPGQAQPGQVQPGQAPQGRALQGRMARGQSDKSMTIVLVDGETVVFASSPERAQMAIQLLKGEVPTLQADSKLVSEMPQDAIAYGAAIDLGSIEQRDGFFPVLRQHELIVWSFGVDNGEAFDRLKLVANSEEVAQQMKTALEGAVAFGKVWAADSPNLSRLAEGTQITVEGKTVERNWRGDSKVLLEGLGEVVARFQQRVEAVRQ